jgi:hypothetical protein
MNDLFNLCVAILKEIANMTGLTYQEANIWIFVIIHPLITIILFWKMIRYRNKLREANVKPDE